MAALWVVLLIANAGRLDFWGDEISSLVGAGETLRDILSGHGSDFHPPFYFVLLHYWMLLFGTSEIALRSLSIVVGGGTIFLSGVLAERLGIKRPWLSPVLLAASPLWVMFCCMARYYSLSAFVYVVLMLTLIRFFASPSPRRGLLWGFVLAAAGYTNYLMFGAALLLGLVMVFFHRTSKVLLGSFCALGLAAAMMMPLGILATGQARGMFVWGEQASFSGFVPTLIFTFVYPFYTFAVSENVFPWSIWVSVPGLVVSLWLVYRGWDRRILRVALLTGLLVGVVVISFIARSLPLAYVPSRLLFLVPVWAMFLAGGIERSRYKVRYFCAAVLLAVYIVGLVNLFLGREYHNTSYLIPWRSIVKVFTADTEPDKIVVTTEEYPLLHYGKGLLRFQLIRPGEDAVRELSAKQPKVVWLVKRDRADRRRRRIMRPVEKWLEEHYVLDREEQYVPRNELERRTRQMIQGARVGGEALGLRRFVRPS